MSKKRVLSGMRPTGKLHLGHLTGALTNWKKFQEEYECFYFVADWHALSTEYANTALIKDNIKEMFIDWLSVGLDPEKATFFVQSHIPEHAELHLLLSMITPLPWLERCPTYKEQLRELKERDLFTYGFLGYPVLQAADILIYKADYVPVGQDQLPHLELTREIARRFNSLYEEILVIPQAKLTANPKLLGTDGRKMSKSYNNAIFLSDDPAVIKKKVQTMVTDPVRIKANDPGHPDVCSVYSLYKVFNPHQVKEIRKKCEEGTIGCVACKKIIVEHLVAALADIQAKRQELGNKPGYIKEILEKGMVKARKVAAQTMAEVRKAMKL
ncbi:MAG: tryptophan--tRNA ligase [bacterium]